MPDGSREEGTLAALRTVRHDIVDPTIAEHGGRIVRTMGDGLLVEFNSVVDAVRCAIAIQRAMPEQGADTPDDRRLRFRFAINMGDVVSDGDLICGDGVTIASRMEALAEPGAINVSRAVRDQVRDRLPIMFEDCGEHEVKNISRPVRVFHVVLQKRPAGAACTGSRRAAAPIDRPALAVLPFKTSAVMPRPSSFSTAWPRT
jgi:class 3 adenylate cyclase